MPQCHAEMRLNDEECIGVTRVQDGATALDTSAAKRMAWRKKGSLRQAQGRLFDCGDCDAFAQDDKFKVGKYGRQSPLGEWAKVGVGVDFFCVRSGLKK